MSYDKQIESKELDINDEKVKDRWSRYIGAMGIDAVSRQSKADILLLGLGPFGLEVTKNLVLSGCRKLTLLNSFNKTLVNLIPYNITEKKIIADFSSLQTSVNTLKI